MSQERRVNANDMKEEELLLQQVMSMIEVSEPGTSGQLVDATNCVTNDSSRRTPLQRLCWDRKFDQGRGSLRSVKQTPSYRSPMPVLISTSLFVPLDMCTHGLE